MSDDAEPRRVAVREIATRPGPGALEQVLGALADDDWRVRKEGAETAAKLASLPGMLEGLAEALLQPTEVGLRNAAIEAFHRVGPPGAEALGAALARAPETARKFVAAAMGGAGGAAVADLTELAADGDVNTANAALEALAMIGGESAERALRAHLSASDALIRLAALEGLARVGARVPVQDLAPLLEDPMVRRLGVRLLGRSDDAAAVPHLRAALLRAVGSELVEVVQALARFHDASEAGAAAVRDVAGETDLAARERLRELVVSDDLALEGGARAAALLLMLAEDLDAIPALCELAARVELGPSVLAALRAFGIRAVRALVDVSQRAPSAAQRAFALEAAAELAAIGDADTKRDLRALLHAVLRNALDDPNEVVMQAGARGLTLWGEPEDAGALVALGSTHPGAIADATGSALIALSQSAPRSVEVALDSAAPDGAAGWSSAIGVLDPEQALEKLRSAIASGEPTARRAALRSLANLGGREAAELASFSLADDDVDVQVAAVTALSRMEAADARELATSALRVAARDARAAVRAAAAEAFAVLGDPAAAEILVELGRDEAPGVARAALASMRRLGVVAEGSAPEFNELLHAALSHADEEVVKEALAIVAESRGPRRVSRLVMGLAHPAWDVRQLAATLLSGSSDAEAQSALKDREAIEADDLVLEAIRDALVDAPSGGRR